MATLPTLRPTSHEAGTGNVINEAAAFTNLHLSVDDDPDSHDGDSTWVENDATGNITSDSCWVELGLTDMPADFEAADTLSVSAAYRGLNRVDDSTQFRAWIVSASGALYTNGFILVSSPANSGTYAVASSGMTVTATGLAASKADWDGARLHLEWTGNQNMSNDGAKIRVTAIEINGTYTQTGLSVQPTGIGSTNAFGSPTLTTGAVNVTPNGIASTTALGSPTLHLDVAPDGIASTTALGSPSVARVGSMPAYRNNTTYRNSFTYRGTIPAGQVNPSGIASTTALGSPTLTPGAVTAAPAGISSTTALGSPTVEPGAVAVAPSGIASTTALGSPIVGSFLTLAPVGIASTTAIGAATVAPGSITAAPTGIASTTALGSHAVGVGAVTVAPTGITSTTATGSPVVAISGGPQPVVVVGVASTTAFGSATISTGAVALSTDGVASTTTFGTPTLGLSKRITPAGVASTTSIGSATVTPGAVTVAVNGRSSLTRIGTPAVSEPYFWFKTPSRRQLAIQLPTPLPSVRLFGRRVRAINEGIAVWKDPQGVWHSGDITLRAENEALRVYRGGRVYRINGEERDELVAQGYEIGV